MIEERKGRVGYPDAAWSPRPLEPPVITATLPSRRKMFGKSWSLTSCSASVMLRVIEGLVKVKDKSEEKE